MSLFLAAVIAAILIGAILLLRRRHMATKPEDNIPATDSGHQIRIISRDEHQIPRQHLDDNALKVVHRLNDDGHEAYLVGGCIRDLLLGLRPKDFDVATSALPEEAEELFRRARLIGRRFKLVHVRFGRDVIEVATFRAGHDVDDNQGGEHGRQAESGLILRDNVYGSLEEDALRRDFTINALYYSPRDHSIHDFVGGFQDMGRRTIRMIGDPEARYREDPVRMLRAVRFAAKLGFDIEPATAAPIRELAPLLGDIASARMFDEVLKLLQSGHGVDAYKQMQAYDLFEPLFPQVQQAIAEGEARGYPVEALILKALRNTDRRLAQRKSVTPAFLFAALLWYPMQLRMNRLMEDGMPAIPALHEAANEVIGVQVRHTAIPRRFSTPLREIWELQLRLPRRQGNRAARLMEHPRFRAAYDLLLLRETSGEDLGGLSQWWTDYQAANPDDRASLQGEVPPGAHKPRSRRRRPRRARND
nr:polynucleotide adenylyltransferase PcnB [Marinobacterium nitratireducens]